jgi:ATP-dependent DNA helicase 2 subunit 2
MLELWLNLPLLPHLKHPEIVSLPTSSHSSLSLPDLPAIAGLIVAMQAQAEYLASKPSWTRKMVLITDGESPLATEDWEGTAEKIKELGIKLAIL